MLTRLLGYTAAVAVGLTIKTFCFPHLFATGWAVTKKLTNRGESCSWDRTLTYYSRLEDFDDIYQRVKGDLVVKDYDAALRIEKTGMPGQRDLWMVRPGTDGEEAGHAWLLARHEWMEQSNVEDHVQPGDVVIDVGAHVGVFTAKALKRGASKVVAIEPDPRNVECLRRNFAPEVAFGRVVVAQVLAWGEKQGVVTIDSLVKDLNLARVHFIRMDIGGAEREALRGASRTLRQDRPRVMLDLNQRPDDPVVLPAILRSANAEYRVSCGPCQEDSYRRRVTPHVVYFR